VREGTMGWFRKFWEQTRKVPVPGGKRSVDRHGPRYFVYEEEGRHWVTYRGEETYALIAEALYKQRRK